MHPTFKFGMVASAIASLLTTGCGIVQPQVESLGAQATRNIVMEHEKATQAAPVVTTTTGSWLMGQSVQVIPTPSPILARTVTYHPAQRVVLADVATWINQLTGLVIDTTEVQTQTVANNAQTAVQGLSPAPGAFVPPLSAPMNTMATGVSTGATAGNQLLSISYEGTLSGLLDVAANKAGVWWKFVDGRISFYRTETKTFYLPALANKSSGSSSISANSAAGGSASGGASSGSSSSTSLGGATSVSNYLVDVWADLEKTAKTVGAGAQVVASPSVGSLTVTGTPSQVRNVEEWAKSLSDNLSQQISITVSVYEVSVTSEDYYNWNPSVVFSSLSAKYGFTLAAPQAPTVVSGTAPLKVAASVLQTATGVTGQYSGSQLAFQALSTLGKVNQTVQQTVVTQNGQPAPMQVADQDTYLASTTAGAPTAIGAAPVPPTLTPGSITTGLTAMFLPRIVNGKVLLAMNLTRSSLLGIGSVSSGGSNIQTPKVGLSTFQQSVSLTPGDSLLLTGLQQNNGKSNSNGVGSPNNFILGGGVDHSVNKKLIAIVITAKVL